MKTDISSSTFKTWFSGSYVLDFKKEEGRNLLIVALKNNFQKEQVESRYREQIKGIANRNSGELIEVVFVVSVKQRDANIEKAPIFSGVPQNFSGNFRKSEALNINKTLESFVVGSSNNLAYLAATKVAEQLGANYNPLLFWGPTGVGKTHLLQAIGNQVVNNNPESKVLYVSAEKFTNDYIESLKNHTQSAFRQKYRQGDLLLIDDVQFLAGKESTQDEFFYTFNELILSQRQVVIASDKHPKTLGKIKERIINRFLGGMTADLGLPDFEMRRAILEKKCTVRSISLSSDVVDFIAGESAGAREIEGMLTSILAQISLSGGKATVDELRHSVHQNDRAGKSLNVEQVLGAVGSYFGLREKDLIGLSRKKRLVIPRQIMMYLLRCDLTLSMEHIGEVAGGRDHSTIVYSISKIEDEIRRNKTFADEILRVRALYAQS